MAFDCLRKPPELWSRVARNSFSSRASTRAPASSLWTIATTSFTPRSIGARVRAWSTRFRRNPSKARFGGGVRCGPSTTTVRAGVPSVQRRTRPRSPRLACRPRSPPSPRPTTSTRSLDAVLAAAGPALAPGDGRDLHPGPRPGRAAAGRVARHGRRGRERWRPRSRDPGHRSRPRRWAARRRSIARRRCRRRGSFVGAYLPLVVSSGGVEVVARVIGHGLAGAARSSTTAERETLTALAALAAVAVDRARLASTAAERSEWFERMAHTDPLTGLANERTVARILELELARAGRQGSEVSLALFDVDDFQSTNRESGARGRRRRPATGRRGPRRVGPARRHGRADRWRRVRARRARLGRCHRRPARARRDRGAAGRSPASRSRSPRASPGSRSTAATPRRSIAAATAALDRRGRRAAGRWPRPRQAGRRRPERRRADLRPSPVDPRGATSRQDRSDRPAPRRRPPGRRRRLDDHEAPGSGRGQRQEAVADAAVEGEVEAGLEPGHLVGRLAGETDLRPAGRAGSSGPAAGRPVATVLERPQPSSGTPAP